LLQALNCGPFVGLNSVNISGGSSTDSWDSTYGDYAVATHGSKGHICSNGAISLSGSSTVHGDAHPGTSSSVTLTGGATVAGSTSSLKQALSEPAVSPGNAATVNNNSNIPKSHNNKNALTGGNFTLSGGDYLTLPAGTYYFGKLTLSGNSYITINSKTIIYCTGDVDVSGGSFANTAKLASNLQLYGMGSKVVLSGGSQTYALVYAPGADITRSGGTSDFFGMMVGKTLTLSGGGGLHYDEALNALLGTKNGMTLVQ